MDPVENPPPGYRPEPRHTLGGKFKNHYVWRTPDGTLVLREVRQERDQSDEVIAFNCAQWGYEPDQMSTRSDEERIAFVRDAYDHGLRVLPPTILPDGSVEFPYLEGAAPLAPYLRSVEQAEGEEKIHELFSDAFKAHEKDVVYGDRWPENMLVDPERGIVHIDFDLKYGEDGKELEIAQLILYVLALGCEDQHAPRSRYLDAVIAELGSSPVPYKQDRVMRFVRTKVSMAPHYAHLAPIVEELRTRLGWA